MAKSAMLLWLLGIRKILNQEVGEAAENKHVASGQVRREADLLRQAIERTAAAADEDSGGPVPPGIGH